MKYLDTTNCECVLIPQEKEIGECINVSDLRPITNEKDDYCNDDLTD